MNPQVRSIVGLSLAAVLTPACVRGAITGHRHALPTLDSSAPLVIGHRGLPALFPEKTQRSYEGAAQACADSLEEDLHLTKTAC